MKKMNTIPEGWVTELDLRKKAQGIPEHELDIMVRALNALFDREGYRRLWCATDNGTVQNYMYGRAPQESWERYLAHVKEAGPNPKLTAKHAGGGWILSHEMAQYVNKHRERYPRSVNRPILAHRHYLRSKVQGIELPLSHRSIMHGETKAALVPISIIEEYVQDLEGDLRRISSTDLPWDGTAGGTRKRHGSPTGIDRLYHGDHRDEL